MDSFGAVPIDDEQASVIRGDAEDDVSRDGCVRGEQRTDETALSQLRSDGFIDRRVRHDRVHGAERLDRAVRGS